ncbi:hypothetical protein DFH07DRAFT_1036310 [Mycena maculata]|uniref:F-box domain-containing protein n=1 Tax=Mycena maculata TaxID=230809 RepID=A0AAD7K3U6_9AGAR|nr:hypothetical protein DFH07DRAFT_1036310 [Mycena maculata]
MSTNKDTPISTPELLELILAQLPIRDLLVTAPLICTMWWAITLSPTLQRALFFEPDPSSSPIQNPLLVENFSPFFAPANQGSTAASLKAMPWVKAPEAFRRVDASWRRMLVSQPPTQRIFVKEIRYHSDLGDYSKSKRQGALNIPALSMGVLYDLAVPLIDRVHSSFCIRWQEDPTIEHDVTLVVYHPRRYFPGRRGPLGEQLCSDGSTSVEIDFGKWVRRGNFGMMGHRIYYTYTFDGEPEYDDERRGCLADSDDEEADRNSAMRVTREADAFDDNEMHDRRARHLHVESRTGVGR